MKWNVNIYIYVIYIFNSASESYDHKKIEEIL